MADRPQTTNPFRYGDLALDDAFTDRVHELQELKADMRNGQNVVVFAPRRYGKSSLIWRPPTSSSPRVRSSSPTST